MGMTISVLYRDEDLIVVDKPAGVLSVPDRYDPDAPVLIRELAKTEGELLVVHRLDKDTSGVLIYARNAEAHRLLSLAFEERKVSKTYLSIVRGSPLWDETLCELSLRTDGDRLHRTLIDEGKGSKEARTAFKVIERFRSGSFSATLVEARPETGRTHQIRVHLAALGFPVLCDPLYGDGHHLVLSKIKGKWKGDTWAERPLLSRTALHAASVEFPPPRTGEPMKVEAPLPKDLRAALTQLKKL